VVLHAIDIPKKILKKEQNKIWVIQISRRREKPQVGIVVD